MPIVVHWNTFIDEGSTLEIKQLALKSIYETENAVLRRIAMQQININTDRAILEDDLLQSTFQKIIESCNRGSLRAMNSRDDIISYIAQIMRNICIDGYRRNDRHVTAMNQIPFNEIDDIIGFDFVQGFQRFALRNRFCYDLIKLKNSGYTYQELINVFNDYSHFEASALNQRYLRCKRRLIDFLNS